MSRSPRSVTLVINPLTIPIMYLAAYRIGSWELHYDANLVSAAAAERFSSELSRMLFWVHHASGPIALGVLTIAVIAALLGYGSRRASGACGSEQAPRRHAVAQRLEFRSFAARGMPVVD